jgi:hypothetical protein
MLKLVIVAIPIILIAALVALYPRQPRQSLTVAMRSAANQPTTFAQRWPLPECSFGALRINWTRCQSE